jgi:hypothetical protein
MNTPYIPSVGEIVIGVLILGFALGALITISVSIWRSLREHKAKVERECVTTTYLEEKLEGLRIAIVSDLKAAYPPEHYGK